MSQLKKTETRSPTPSSVPVCVQLLEIGAGNVSVGRRSAQFTDQLRRNESSRRMVLSYANRTLPRPWKGRFNDVLAMSSDRREHRHTHLAVDVTAMNLPDRSFHFVVSVGPREYGFRNQFTAFELLKEVFRVLKLGGEFHVFGNYENPWFNMDMNSREGQKLLRAVARGVGFRVMARLRRIRSHPWYGLFVDEPRITTINCRGRVLKPPTHFHVLKKNKR